MTSNNEPMDCENLSIAVEQAEQNSERNDLVGPVSLFICMHFIMMQQIFSEVRDAPGAYLTEIFESILPNDTILDDEMKQLQTFADKFCRNLYISVIDKNEKSFDYKNLTARGQSEHRSYLAFDKSDRSFYTFYVNKNNKIHTIFPMNDTHVLKLFEDLVNVYKWPYNSDTTEQIFQQDMPVDQQERIPINSMNHAEDLNNAENQSHSIISEASLCDLLVQNVKRLTTYIRPQLNNSHLLYERSKFEIHDSHLSSPATASASLSYQFQQLSKLTDIAAQRFIKSTKTSTSIETSETPTKTVQLLNNPQQDILCNNPIHAQASFTLSSQTKDARNTNLLANTPISKPKLLNQPKRRWHYRTLQDLSKNVCPAVQVEGAEQSTPFQFKFEDDIKQAKEVLYLGAHAVTYDRKEHDQKFVVPIHTLIKDECDVKTSDLNCLMFPENVNDNVKFDLSTKGVFSIINPNEPRKELSFKMINLFKSKKITKDLIERKKLNWCRLMFAIYVKLSNDRFERVSPPKFSDIIEQTYGSQEISSDTVLPVTFCKNGGQLIFIPLNETIEKCYLQVKCNDRKLDDNEFQVHATFLSFESPACKQNRNDIHVDILNTQTNQLITFKWPYYSHYDHSDPCGVADED